MTMHDERSIALSLVFDKKVEDQIVYSTNRLRPIRVALACTRSCVPGILVQARIFNT